MTKTIALCAAALMLGACASDVLPSTSRETAGPFESYEIAEIAYRVIEPGVTDGRKLRELGIDPRTTPNLRVINYVEVMRVFIPPFKGYHVKGVTFVSNKWEWVAREARGTSARGAFIVRASVGRYGDEAVLERDDDELVRLVRSELTAIAGLPPVTIDHRVTRWQHSIPQYHVGHVELVERAKRALADVPGLALAGAAYDGVGVASCIASGRRAAMDIIRHLDETSEQAYG